MKRTQNLIVVALALLLFSFHVRLKRQADPAQINEMAQEVMTPALWKGKIAPSFELTRTDGSKFVLADHIGKEVVILNFFATWCGPCRAETPELNRFVAESRGKPVTLIGIDNSEKPDLVAAYVRDLKVQFPVAIDEGAVEKSYGVKSFPTTVVIGADGRVALYETGVIANTEVAFGAELKTALAAIARNEGIGRETYLTREKAESYSEVRTPAAKDEDSVLLTGRAKQLAGKMNCVCGCTKSLATCTCSTATGMKKKLQEAKLDGTNDVAVMQQVNAEFCMKGM
ncbi:MAG TPA: TlpA disulfide reductase family protein [Thermoanaerobaculia bacterium]|jgi:thiol-disulfide isomerase/thioredoxin|nr:TlpA disulfide reductase family protein [Thermoanaerobaculia bacterium]